MKIDQHIILEEIEGALDAYKLPEEPAGLYDPIRYAMLTGGKRLRPMLAVAVARALGGRTDMVINQAIGVEMFHNFTLLHDDVMDHASVRRGRPTVHVKWDERTAILSGDAMLTCASQLVMRGAGERIESVLTLFNRTAMEVYEGQQMDMDFEPRMDVTEAEYLEMIRLKTSVLLACACRMGALMAGASEAVQQAFYEFGINLGLAFQLQDDYLDTFGDPVVFGKAIGGDILNDKKTWLLIKALGSEYGQELRKYIGVTSIEPVDKISRVTDIYQRAGLPQKCHDLIEHYAREAMKSLSTVDMDADSIEFFSALVAQSATRTH